MSTFEGTLAELATGLQTEEFCHYGVLDEFKPVGYLRGSGDFQHLFFHKVLVL